MYIKVNKLILDGQEHVFNSLPTIVLSKLLIILFNYIYHNNRLRSATHRYIFVHQNKMFVVLYSRIGNMILFLFFTFVF